jgi:hypothetical protein
LTLAGICAMRWRGARPAASTENRVIDGRRCSGPLPASGTTPRWVPWGTRLNGGCNRNRITHRCGSAQVPTPPCWAPLTRMATWATLVRIPANQGPGFPERGASSRTGNDREPPRTTPHRTRQGLRQDQPVAAVLRAATRSLRGRTCAGGRSGWQCGSGSRQVGETAWGQAHLDPALQTPKLPSATQPITPDSFGRSTLCASCAGGRKGEITCKDDIYILMTNFIFFLSPLQVGAVPHLPFMGPDRSSGATSRRRT